jgi:hypothetical protein
MTSETKPSVRCTRVAIVAFARRITSGAIVKGTTQSSTTAGAMAAFSTNEWSSVVLDRAAKNQEVRTEAEDGRAESSNGDSRWLRATG